MTAGLDGNVDDTLQVDRPALPPGDVGCEHRLGPGQADAIGERPSPEPGEDYRVDSADADNGQHQDDGLDGRRHIDRDAVAPPDPEAPQGGGNPFDLAEQLPVGERAPLAELVQPDDGGVP